MAISTASACLILLGTLCLSNAAPAPVRKELEGLVISAKHLYDELRRIAYEAYLQQEDCECPTSHKEPSSDNTAAFPAYPSFPGYKFPSNEFPSNEIPRVITGYNGDNDMNFGDGGNGMHIVGK